MAILSELKVGDRLEIQPRESYSGNDHDSTIVSQLIDIKENSAFIVNPIKQGVSYPLVVGQRIKIVFFREDKGIYRFVADVKSKVQKSMTIYEIVPSGEVEKIQRRYYYRLDVVRKALINLRDEKREIEASTKDLSGGGMKVYSKEALPIKSKVDCRLFLNDTEPIEISGEVVRCFFDPEVKEYVIGISFKAISETTQSKIISFIFERQRLLRKKGLI